jgi:plastocyanin
VVANGLPTNGETVYARLFTYVDGVTVFTDYTYTAASQAVLTAPAPATVLAGPTVTFTWSAGTGNTTGYSLWLGSTGVGSNNLYHSGLTTATAVKVGGLPANGAPIYARLYTYINGSTVSTDYTFTAASQAVLTTPAPTTTLAGSSVTFTWTPGTGSTTGYSLYLGSTGAGSNNLYHSGATTATSVTANGLPTNGETVYARLFTYIDGVTVFTDYTYTAQ